VPRSPLVVALLTLSWACPAAADDTADLVARVRPSVVTLQTQDALGRPTGNGTGFLISSDGLVVTNHHVSASAPSVALLSDGSRRAVLGLLVSDETSDVAILRIEGGGYPALPLGAPTPPAVRDRVLVVGSPLGFSQTVTEGQISALRPDGPPPEAALRGVAQTSLIQITADIAPGSSGSPVVTPEGNVIGVEQSADALNDAYFAVDIAAVKALQARAPADGALTPLEGPLRQLLQTLGLVAGLVGLAVTPGVFGWARAWLAARARRRGRGNPGRERPPTRFLPGSDEGPPEP